MEGPRDNPGLNYRTLAELFAVQRERTDFEYRISVSVLEIYNEQIFDLLVPPPPKNTLNSVQRPLDIRQTAHGIVVPDLSTVVVNSAEDVMQVLKRGFKNRSTGQTDANEHSSRSHCVLSVTVSGRNSVTGLETLGKLNLVDLAGSERVGRTSATGERLREAQYINKSLLALGDAVSALSQKNAHIPFRNSKLTHLLQDSLGGNSKTCFVVNVSPSESCLNETLCSLQFAARVNTVELGRATPTTAKRQTLVNSSSSSSVSSMSSDNSAVPSSPRSTPSLPS